MLELDNLSHHLIQLGSSAAISGNSTLQGAVCPVSGWIADIFLKTPTPGSTTATTVDINKNGTSIYSTRPTVAASTGTVSYGTLSADPTPVSAGDILELAVDAFGGSPTGMYCMLVISRTPVAACQNVSNVAAM